MEKDTNMFRNIYKVNKVERLENNIKDERKSVIKDSAFLGASAIAVGIGALGVSLLGDDLINSFKTEELLTYSTYMKVRFQEAGVGISLASIIGGIVGAFFSIKHLIPDSAILKSDKKQLKLEREKLK